MRTVSRYLRVTSLILLLAAGSLTGISRARAANPINIAIMGPFTGPAASVGVEQLNFAKLAVADFKASSGMDINLIEFDTQLDAAKAVTAAQAIISNDAIVGVNGPSGSQEVDAVSKAFDQAGFAFISPSATRPALTEAGIKGFFRVVPRDDVQGPTDVNFMLNTLHVKSVYVIDDQTSYSTGLADIVEKALKAANVNVQRDSVTQKDTDFSALVTRMKGSTPDVIFMPFQIASEAVQILKQAQEQGIKAIGFGGDGVFSPDDFIKNAAGATEGDYVSFFAPDIHGVAASASIVAAYEKQYGSFGSFGGPSYAATIVMLEAVQRAAKAGTVTRQAVRAEVAKTDDASSVLGIPIKFDAKGDIVGASFYLFQVKGDKFVLVPNATPAASATMSATMAATMAATAAK